MSTSKMALKRFMSETRDNLKQYIILPVNSAVWYSVGMELVTQWSAKYCHFIRYCMGHSTALGNNKCWLWLMVNILLFCTSFHYCIFTLQWFRQAYAVVTERWKWDWESVHGLDGLPDKIHGKYFHSPKVTSCSQSLTALGDDNTYTNLDEYAWQLRQAFHIPSLSSCDDTYRNSQPCLYL